MNVTVPALTRVMRPELASIVATPGALLPYTIAPARPIVGTATLNGVSPYVFEAATENAVSEVAPSATVSIAVALASEYALLLAWMTVIMDEPTATIVTSFTGRSVIPETQLLVAPVVRVKLINVPAYPPVSMLFAAVVIPVFAPLAVP